MIHWKARRLLASLPDNTLAKHVELEVRVHVASCARCRSIVKEQELAEALLKRLPASIQPLEWSSRDYNRLARLARWSHEPAPPPPDRWRAPILSLVGAVAILAIAILFGRYSPVYDPTLGPIGPASLAQFPPDATYVPSHWH